MNTTTSFAAKLAAFHAANAAIAAKTKYAKYRVHRVEASGDTVVISEVSFPNDVRNANFFGVCFYDAATDTFRGTTEVNGWFVDSAENINVKGTRFLLERVV